MKRNLAAFVLLNLMLVSFAATAGTLTPATGGESIPADSDGGSYTTLDGPVYEEENSREVGQGSIILELPTEFEWDTSSLPQARVEELGGGGQNINRVNDGGTFSASSVTSNQVTFDINETSVGQRRNRLTFEGLRVRPVAGASGASGEIVHVGGSDIQGVQTGTTSWGTLQQGGTTPPGDVVLSANGETDSPVAVTVGEDVEFIAEANDCPSSVFLEWRVTWSVEGNDPVQNAIGDPCDTPPSLTENFGDQGEFDVAVTLDYRYCFGVFGCGAWNEHGSDSLVLAVGGADQCFVDDFQRSDLGDDWVTTVSNGSFTPQLINDRLRMTEASGNQATAASLQRELPGADNLVVLEFDYYAYDGSGADGLSVVLSDASLSPQAGGFGGSLGYAQTSGGGGNEGFAGGWLGIGLDEYGNFSNPTESREGGPGRTPQSVALRGSGSGFDGYGYIDGTGTLSPGIDATGSASPHRYRIIVDSRQADVAEVTVERDVDGSGFTTLIGPIDVLAEQDQASVPDNFLLSLTGSTGGSTNVHELGNIELCAQELNPIGDQVDHFELEFGEVALTCQPHDVTIRACENEDCSELFTDEVEVTMAPEGWVGGDTFSFTGGSTSRRLQVTSEQQVTLGVDSSSPTQRPFTDNLCRQGSGPLGADQCDLMFRDSGLAMDIPEQTSHRPSDPIAITAVERDDETNACVPAFADVQREVDFWSDYVDPGPSGRPASRPVSVNGSTVGQSQSNADTLELDFDSSGTAEIELVYPDAGLMALNARYEGSSATDDEGLIMPGDSQWVSVPEGLCVETPFSCAAGDSTCPAAHTAADPFNLSVTAVGWSSSGNSNLCSGNPATPNFELRGIDMEHTLVAPGSGELGSLESQTYDHARSGDGETTTDQAVSEVGVFEFRAVPGTGTFFGATVPAGTSAPAGRFIPDRFDVAVTDPGAIDSFCGSSGSEFAYSGQELNWLDTPEISVTALNADANVTRNYTIDPFRRLSGGDVTRASPTADATTTNSNGVLYPVDVERDPLTLIDANAGIINFGYASTDILTYEKTTDSLVDPFLPDLRYGITDVTDSDGVAGQGLPVEFAPDADFELRYGRLQLQNTFGPETLDLTVPMRAEYWQGGQFELNVDEGCWSYDTDTDVAVDQSGLDSGSSSTVPVVDSLVAGEPTSGSELVLTAPGEGNTGEVGVTFGVPIWLKDDFNGDGSLEDPTATATFGVFRGHDRIIYWREAR